MYHLYYYYQTGLYFCNKKFSKQSFIINFIQVHLVLTNVLSVQHNIEKYIQVLTNSTGNSGGGVAVQR